MAVIKEAYIQGISTRAVDDLVRAMHCRQAMQGIAERGLSQVSRLCEEIHCPAGHRAAMSREGRACAGLPEPPAEGRLALPVARRHLCEATRGREDCFHGGDSSRRALSSLQAATAEQWCNTDGRREILGITVMPSEAETFWTDFLRSLTRRGLRGVQVVISDAHEDLKAFVGQTVPRTVCRSSSSRKVLSAGWQRCRVHVQRNLLARVNKANKPVVSETRFQHDGQRRGEDRLCREGSRPGPSAPA